MRESGQVKTRLANCRISYPSGLLSPLPHMSSHIRISPFSPLKMEELLKTGTEKNSSVLTPRFWLDNGREITFASSGRQALKMALNRIGLQRDESVLIITTTGGPYISSCVTTAINEICRWTRDPEVGTKAVLLIHEFGFPCELPRFLSGLNLPVIEDCAYGIGSRIAGAAIGSIGDYAIYSLPKYYPVPFGGMLISKKEAANICEKPLPDDDKDFLTDMLMRSSGSQEEWNKIRRSNWEFFERQLRDHSVHPYFNLEDGVVPGTFIARAPFAVSGAQIKKNCVDAGIEATEYYGNDGFYFPIHQFLTDYERTYILLHFLMENV